MILNIKRSFAIFPFIFLRKSGTSVIEAAHENVHRLRQGLWFIGGVTLTGIMTQSFLWSVLGGLGAEAIWFILYFISKKFRWIEEKPAWRAQIKAELKEGVRTPVGILVYVLTTQYWGMVDKRQARKFLESL